VRLTEIVPERFHRLTGEVAKFGIIGVVNIVVNFAVVNLLLVTVFPKGELKANTVAVIVATTSAYFMNRHWTYRDRPKSTLRREYSLFFFFNLIGLFIQVGTVAFTKYGLHEGSILATNISTGVGIALGTLFRFWSYRTHVFKEAAVEPEPVALAAALADVPDDVAEPVDALAALDLAPVLDLDSELGLEPALDFEPAEALDFEPAEAADFDAEPAGPRLVVTSSAGGSVVIKVLNAAEDADAADEIELDDPVRARS
jgi:putative flippase GtrA